MTDDPNYGYFVLFHFPFVYLFKMVSGLSCIDSTSTWRIVANWLKGTTNTRFFVLFYMPTSVPFSHLEQSMNQTSPRSSGSLTLSSLASLLKMRTRKGLMKLNR